MTDEQKAELTRLVDQYLKAEAEYVAAEEALDKCDHAIREAEQSLALAMEAADLTYVTKGKILLWRDGESIDASAKGFLTLP